MEIRTLHYFLTVAREETISGAAKVLHITQPTLSRQMMELEEELGNKLFLRGRRNITLTDEGMLLRKRAEEIVALVQKTEAEFSAPEEIVGGDIYIGGGETDVMRIVAQIAGDLRQDYPDIRFHLHSGNAQDVMERLDKGLIDFGVLINPVDLTKYHHLSLPRNDTWGVLMRKDSPLAAQGSIRPDDLWDLPLICSKQAMVSDTLANWMKKDYETWNLIATYNLIFNASILVQEGLGYAITLDQLVNTSGNSNLCFRPLEPKLEAGLHLVWKKYQVFSKVSQLFLNRMKQHLEQ